MYSLTKKRKNKQWAGEVVFIKPQHLSATGDDMPIAANCYVYELGGYLLSWGLDREACISYYKLRRYYV